MSDGPLIQGCEPPYATGCPGSWDALGSGPTPQTRQCHRCSLTVRLCASAADIKKAELLRERVAAEPQLARRLAVRRIPSLAKLREAHQAKQRDGARIGYRVIKAGSVEESNLTEFLSKRYGVPAINLREFVVEREVLALVPRSVASFHCLIPVKISGSTLIIATSDPSDVFAIDELTARTGRTVEVVVAAQVAIEEAIERHYSAGRA